MGKNDVMMESIIDLMWTVEEDPIEVNGQGTTITLNCGGGCSACFDYDPKGPLPDDGGT